MARFNLPKRVRRAISTDEHLHAYYRRLVNEATKRGRIKAVERLRTTDGVIEVLQIVRVVDTGDGLIIQVR